MQNKGGWTKVPTSLLLLLCSLCCYAQKSVIINEVMQSNIDYLMVDNDFPDSWVELYNTTNRSLSIAGWRLGEKKDFSKAYALPSPLSIPAHGHLVVYCDKKGEGIHTDFRVDAGHAELYLFDATGIVRDTLAMDEMPAPNIAYGRTQDGASEWYYEFTPTAGNANAGGGTMQVLPDPIFDLEAGSYSETNYLTITMPEGVPSDAIICYTKDGTEPIYGQSSATRRPFMAISKTTIVRAKIVSPSGEALSRPSITRSYIFHPRQVTMPIMSIVSNREYFYNATYGILMPNVNNGVPNYMQKWRRPINIEMLSPTEGTVFNQLAETAVSGVSTRELAQKSLKVYTNKRFGKKNFKGTFWEDKPEVDKIPSFVLRNGGNNCFGARINDALVQRLFGTHTDSLNWQAYAPVIVYLNGTYMGVYAMRERSDETYIETNHEELKDNFEIHENPSFVNGDVEMTNFINTTIAELYAMNTDFPTNNVSVWRPYTDNLWRWNLKDMDRFGMSLPLYPMTFNMVSYLFNPDDLQYGGLHQFDLYKRLSKNTEFSNRFVETFAVYLGDFLRADYVSQMANDMEAEIESELRATFTKYNTSYTEHTSAMRWLQRIIDSRQENLYSQLASYFKLGSVVPLTIENREGMLINGISLQEGDFNGSYFSSHPLYLNSGAENYGWKLSVIHNNGSQDDKLFEQADLTLMLKDYALQSTDKVELTTYRFAEDPVSVNEISASTKGTSAIKIIRNNHIVIQRDDRLYDVTGRMIR